MAKIVKYFKLYIPLKYISLNFHSLFIHHYEEVSSFEKKECL